MKKIVALSCAVSLLWSSTAFAGQWMTGSKGWWYDNGNGSYPASAWQWIDGNGDGTAECYYFDSEGWLVTNSTTADGYQVDADGRWILDGVMQTKQVGAAQASAAQSGASENAQNVQMPDPDSCQQYLQGFASLVYGLYLNGISGGYAEKYVPVSFTNADLSPEIRADMLYWYQLYLNDSRIQTNGNKFWEHIASTQDLEAIMRGMFGDAGPSALGAFYAKYGTLEGSVCRMDATGTTDGMMGPFGLDWINGTRAKQGASTAFYKW